MAADDPELTAALWQFLADHVYHRVKLLGESAVEWDEVGPEFVEIGGGDVWCPTLEEYAAGWPALPLMSAPRPLAEAVHRAVEEASDRLPPGLWSPNEAESAAMRILAILADQRSSLAFSQVRHADQCLPGVVLVDLFLSLWPLSGP